MMKKINIIFVCFTLVLATAGFSIAVEKNTIDDGNSSTVKEYSESKPILEVGLATVIGNGLWEGLTGQSLVISIKNVGNVTAHNITLVDLTIDGKVLYNNRVTEWHDDVEPGVTAFREPHSLFFGFGTFTATISVTCDEEVNGTGSGNGLMIGPFLFVP